MKKISAAKAAAGMLLFLLLGLAAGLYLAPPALKEAVFLPADISSILPEAGYRTANASIDGNRVELLAGCDALSFDVTDDQALSIGFGLEKKVFSRPLTHDIIKDIIDHYGITVESAAIDSFEDDTYKAKIFLRQGSKVLNLDSRPSDAIAIAARYGMGVKVKSDILERRGSRVC